MCFIYKEMCFLFYPVKSAHMVKEKKKAELKVSGMSLSRTFYPSVL